jgi:hypothetical protein
MGKAGGAEGAGRVVVLMGPSFETPHLWVALRLEGGRLLASLDFPARSAAGSHGLVLILARFVFLKCCISCCGDCSARSAAAARDRSAAAGGRASLRRSLSQRRSGGRSPRAAVSVRVSKLQAEQQLRFR